MKLDYITQLNPYPIYLPIGTIIKPKLKDIAGISKGMNFDKFSLYEILLKATPEFYYTKMAGDKGTKYWENTSEYKKSKMTIYDVIIKEDDARQMYLDLLNFFFLERVIFIDNTFVILNDKAKLDDDILSDADIKGVISPQHFPFIIDIIQQICCIADRDKVDEVKFKNDLARKIYMKIHSKDKEKKEKPNIHYSLPNLISAVANKHPSINLINIWDLTIFELIDAFHRLQASTVYDIESTRVSVWGDKEKKFDVARWYKNEYDKS